MTGDVCGILIVKKLFYVLYNFLVADIPPRHIILSDSFPGGSKPLLYKRIWAKKLQPARKCAKKLSLQENCKNYNCKKICKKLSLQENANNYKCEKLVKINHKKRNKKICRKARVGNSLFYSSFFHSQKTSDSLKKIRCFHNIFTGFPLFNPFIPFYAQERIASIAL